MKKIPEKLNENLLRLTTAIKNSDLQQALDAVELVDWPTYTVVSLANLNIENQILWALMQHDDRCRKTAPRKKNVFFEKVFTAALEKGFDPYAEDKIFDLHNTPPSSFVKHFAKIMDAHPHKHLQHSSFLASVCCNYLVHPWMLKYALNLPNAAAALRQETSLFDHIWNGETTDHADEKDILIAHQYLLDHKAPITFKFVQRLEKLIDIPSKYPDIQKRAEELCRVTRSAYEKQILLSATHQISVHQMPVKKKM